MATFFLKIEDTKRLLIDEDHYLIIGLRVAGTVTQREDLEGPSQESVDLIGPSQESVALEGPSQETPDLVGV